jgi:iron complex transport system substrate-binding protein
MFLLLAVLAGGAVGAEAVQRVVSLDYCADQYVLKLLPRNSILALSRDADQPFSYMRDAAKGLPQVRAIAEDVMVLRPDLVVRSYGGGPRASAFFERAGIPVLQVPYANDLEQIREALHTVATGLGVAQRGADVVAELDRRLTAIDSKRPRGTAMYMTSGGATSGPGTLVHEMLLAAGMENFETEPGWREIPLERLAYRQPDLIAAAYFSRGADATANWSAMRHPVARRQTSERPTVMLQGAWTSCGGWFVVDAIEALAETSAELGNR